MKVQVLAKSAVDLQETKDGAYAFMFLYEGGSFKAAKIFSKKCPTLTYADVSAYVNALYFLSTSPGAPELQEIEIITDSGKVVDLLSIFKYEKHCEQVAAYWRALKASKFPKLVNVNFVRVEKKAKSNDNNNFLLQTCSVLAHGQLNSHKSILK